MAALRRALTEQVLDASAGHCNNCGVQFDRNNDPKSPHILDGCGAVSFTHHVLFQALRSSFVTDLVPQRRLESDQIGRVKGIVECGG